MSETAPDERAPWLVALQDLYERRGQPRTRALGQQSDMSHQTVNEYLHGVRKPPLDKLLRLVHALGGDTEVFTDLWQDARKEVPPATPTERELLGDILTELRAIRAAIERDATGSREAV